jgi:hypothetical protein
VSCPPVSSVESSYRKKVTYYTDKEGRLRGLGGWSHIDYHFHLL